jgi:exopolysaccharide biosynthesis polyprenyl glycosylphosphotransferase
VVEANLQALATPRRLTWVHQRARLRWVSAAADALAIAGAYAAALTIRAFVAPVVGLPAIPFAPEWTVAILVVTVMSAFYASGLYELEAYVSRALHLWTLIRASLFAFLISALVVFAVRSDVFDESRLVLLLAFMVFVALACVLRLGLLDSLYVAWARQRRPLSYLLGDSEATRALANRLNDLRGFDRVELVTPSALRLGLAEALRPMLEDREQTAWVFIDASSGTPREVLEAADAAQTLGTEVYVVSPLVKSLEGSRLLSTLFEAPVVRVRRSIGDAKPYALKRVFDVVGSAAMLLICLPVIATLAAIIRLTSPGPAFYTQTRVGRFGVPFEFLKLRSMVVNRDASAHSEYVRAFINGQADAVATGTEGEAVFKLVDDPRITPIGKFIRKYSLDEIPQFYNVLRGDMSLVGPRPPLPYEVSEYDDWHSLRLNVPSGITGLWQVEGRSRVSFDEMILQDVMYAQNTRLLLDLNLCLRTVPATLLGGGGG